MIGKETLPTIRLDDSLLDWSLGHRVARMASVALSDSGFWRATTWMNMTFPELEGSVFHGDST